MSKCLHSTTTIRFICAVASMAGILAGTSSYGQTGTTQAAVPNSSGNDVKSGDVIIWKVNKPIALQPGTEKNASSTPESAPASTTPTTTDTVTAAVALSVAAHKLVIPPAPGATTTTTARYNAAYLSAQQADQAADKAKIVLFDSQDKRAATPPGTLAAATNAVAAAQKALESSQEALYATTAKSLADQNAAEAAKQLASRPNASQTLKDDYKTAVGLAQASATATKVAEGKRDQAADYLSAAVNAVSEIATAPPTKASGNAGPVTATKTCFPVGSRFNVTNVVAATKPASTSTTDSTSKGNAASSQPQGTAQNVSSNGSTATPSNTQIVSGHFSSDTGFSILHLLHYHALPISQPTAPTLCGADAGEIAVLDKNYDFTADQLSKQEFYREGFTWGGLVIPYKFYFKDKSIKSNSSIVGFAGYEGWIPGASLSLVLAAGAGTTPSTTTPAGTVAGTGTTPGSTTSTSTTVVTYTVATGLILAFGDSKTVKAGLMFGRDYQGNASAFAYENKTWMALSIGAGF
jgi:hypothetical protein